MTDLLLISKNIYDLSHHFSFIFELFIIFTFLAQCCQKKKPRRDLMSRSSPRRIRRLPNYKNGAVVKGNRDGIEDNALKRAGSRNGYGLRDPRRASMEIPESTDSFNEHHPVVRSAYRAKEIRRSLPVAVGTEQYHTLFQCGNFSGESNRATINEEESLSGTPGQMKRKASGEHVRFSAERTGMEPNIDQFNSREKINPSGSISRRRQRNKSRENTVVGTTQSSSKVVKRGNVDRKTSSERLSSEDMNKRTTRKVEAKEINNNNNNNIINNNHSIASLKRTQDSSRIQDGGKRHSAERIDEQCGKKLNPGVPVLTSRETPRPPSKETCYVLGEDGVVLSDEYGNIPTPHMNWDKPRQNHVERPPIIDRKEYRNDPVRSDSIKKSRKVTRKEKVPTINF